MNLKLYCIKNLKTHFSKKWIYYVLLALFIICLAGFFPIWRGLVKEVYSNNSISMDVISKVAILIGGVFGFLITLWRASCNDRETRVIERGYITDRFIKVTEQLSSDKKEVQLGAVFSLLRIGEDSFDVSDKKAVLDMLCSYVRDKQQSPAEDMEELENILQHYMQDNEFDYSVPELAEGTKVILSTILNTEKYYIPNGYCIDLSNLFLFEYHFEAIKRSNINMFNGVLLGIKIEKSTIDDSNLDWCHFNCSKIHDTTFKNVLFECSKFDNAVITKTKFINCNLSRVIFKEATLNDVDFRSSFFIDSYGKRQKITKEFLACAAIKEKITY